MSYRIRQAITLLDTVTNLVRILSKRLCGEVSQLDVTAGLKRAIKIKKKWAVEEIFADELT